LQRTSEKVVETFETYTCNIRVQPLQHMQDHDLFLQHSYETIEIYSCNMRFQPNISLLFGRMEARRCVVIIGDSSPTALVVGRPATVATRRVMEASGARAAGRPRLHDLERPARHRTWQHRQPRAVTWRRSCDVPDNASGHALRGGRRADKSDRKRNEWIGISG
jgi:hypothetical protein